MRTVKGIHEGGSNEVDGNNLTDNTCTSTNDLIPDPTLIMRHPSQQSGSTRSEEDVAEEYNDAGCKQIPSLNTKYTGGDNLSLNPFHKITLLDEWKKQQCAYRQAVMANSVCFAISIIMFSITLRWNILCRSHDTCNDKIIVLGDITLAICLYLVIDYGIFCISALLLLFKSADTKKVLKRLYRTRKQKHRQRHDSTLRKARYNESVERISTLGKRIMRDNHMERGVRNIIANIDVDEYDDPMANMLNIKGICQSKSDCKNCAGLCLGHVSKNTNTYYTNRRLVCCDNMNTVDSGISTYTVARVYLTIRSVIPLFTTIFWILAAYNACNTFAISTKDVCRNSFLIYSIEITILTIHSIFIFSWLLISK